jgi:hypothetical protein
MSDTQSREQLLTWMKVLENYGRDWDETFGGYFTQEYWYLLVGCVVANWEGKPLTVSEACQTMKTGSNRTREERIKKAVLDGYLVKEKSKSDGREARVVHTPKLDELVMGHFQRTLDVALEKLSESKV